MTAHDDQQREFSDRLMAALTKLDVFTRRDEQNRLFASDGEHEYEVAITVDEHDTNHGHRGASKLVVGQRTLRRVEGGDVSALFWWGVKRPPPRKPAVTAEPVSPYYDPLEWSGDELTDQDGSIEAQGADWKYEIWSVADSDGAILGYQIRGGDMEESEYIGSLDIDGRPGERTLQDAKAAAQANYTARYVEVEQILFDTVGGYEDDGGNPLTRRDAQGRIFCRVEELGGEIEIVATLVDYGDFFDAAAHRWAVCTRSVNTYSYSGDWLEGMYHDMRRAGVLDSNGSQ